MHLTSFDPHASKIMSQHACTSVSSASLSMDVQDQLIKCTIEDMDTPKARKGQLLPDEFDVDAYNVSACLFHTLEDRVPHTQEHDPS